LQLHENNGVHAAIVKMASNLLEKPEVQDCLSEELNRWEMIEIPGGLSVPVLKDDSETVKLAACLKKASLLPPVAPPSSCVPISSDDPFFDKKQVKLAENLPPEAHSTQNDSAFLEPGQVESKCGAEVDDQPSVKPRRRKSKRSKSKKEKEPGLLTRVANWIKTTIFGAIVETPKKKSKSQEEKKVQVPDIEVDEVPAAAPPAENVEGENAEKSKTFPWAEAALGVALGVLVLMVFRRHNPAFFEKVVILLKR
jgi:hypothetical protein